MNMYWGFELRGVARNCIYLDALKEATTMAEVKHIIDTTRPGLASLREWKPIQF